MKYLFFKIAISVNKLLYFDKKAVLSVYRIPREAKAAYQRDWMRKFISEYEVHSFLYLGSFLRYDELETEKRFTYPILVRPQIWQSYPSNFADDVRIPSRGRINLLIREIILSDYATLYAITIQQRYRQTDDIP